METTHAHEAAHIEPWASLAGRPDGTSLDTWGRPEWRQTGGVPKETRWKIQESKKQVTIFPENTQKKT